MEKILLGMSGGVDSTVSAALLKESGYDVCGVFFIMDDSHAPLIADAEKAAKDVGVPIDVVDLRPEFRKNVICPFTEEYLCGKTPNPCVMCNKTIKFPYLAKQADEKGIAKIASGHYASVTESDGVFYISRGADTKKDQSYFLWGLGQDILSRLVLPLSEMTKEEIRAFAAARGFGAASKRDSQDVCFIPDGDSGKYVAEASHARIGEGPFTDASGRVLGKHKGIFNYTVGQRRGLGIAAEAPLYVLEIKPDENRVILGRENELYRDRVEVENCSFAKGTAPSSEFSADVCLRYTKKPAHARIVTQNNTCVLYFDTAQRAPAPGQSAVFYEGDRVIGGGIILK